MEFTLEVWSVFESWFGFIQIEVSHEYSAGLNRTRFETFYGLV